MAGCCECLCPHRGWNNVLPDNGSFGMPLSTVDMVVYPSQWENQRERAPEREDDTGRTTKSLRASICLKLTVFVSLLVVIAAGVPTLVLWLKAHEQLVEEIERRLITVSTLRQEQLRDYLSSETDKTELIGTRVLINNFLANTSRSNRSLAQFDLSSAVEVISDFTFAACYDMQGQLTIATDDSVFGKTIDQADMDAIRSTGVKISYPMQTPLGWMYNISRAIYRRQTMVGILITWVNATKLVDLVYDRTGLQTTGELLIGAPEGVDKVHLLFPPLQRPDLIVARKGGAMARAINGESGIMTLRDYSGAKVIAAYRPVEFMHWGLLAKLDIDEAYAPVKSVRTVIITTIVILVFVGMLASLGLAKIFSRPIVELGRAAVALGQGDMTTRVRKGTVLLRDELADLKDIFNSMAYQISHHHQILEHKVTERTADLARANEGLANEVNERRKIEIELEKAKDVAMAANKSKSEFLANMSHEIRTPLNAIINFTEFCLDTKVTPEQKEHLDQVRFAAQHLLRLITDILDFSKIEAGKLEIEEIPFSLYDQLEHAVSVLAARALENDIELCCSFEADVPDEIMGDPGRLLQIFVNLIGNGIKFTKKGEVVVSVSVKNKVADAIELLFAVKDTGLGIPENKQPLLFQAFSQLDSSTQRLYGGTGLGLVISSKLAVAMGGRMWVESDGIEDHGSIFWFTAKFRLSPSLNTLITSSRPGLFKDVRGLVVDDNETSRRILVDFMKNLGMVAHSAGSVEAALSILQKAADVDQKYNIVLLDLWLKGADASELIFILRQRPALLENCVLGKAFPDVSQASKDLASKTAMEDKQSPNDQGSEIVTKNKQDPITSGDRTVIEDELLSKDPRNKTTIKDDSYLASSSSTSDVGDSNIVNAYNTDIPGSSGKVDQHSLGNLLHVDQIPGRAKVSSTIDHVMSSIIVLTSVNHTDVNRCKELGIINHISKPIKRALLVRVLQSALGTEEYSLLERESSLGQESPSRSLHILVAEDNVINQHVAVILLKKWGHTAVLAGNGAEAVDKAANEKFDMILMDVQMPICDGFEATAKIRELEISQKERNHIPIVAMTAHAMCGDGERCIAAGMDYYVSKPLNAKKLQALLQSVAAKSVSGSSGKFTGRSAVSEW